MCDFHMCDIDEVIWIDESIHMCDFFLMKSYELMKSYGLMKSYEFIWSDEVYMNWRINSYVWLFNLHRHAHLLDQ